MDSPNVITKTQWVIDPAHSVIGFRVKHLMVTNVRGRFKDFDADIFTAGNDFRSAEIDVRIKAASIDTGTEMRDEHLCSADFFDANQFMEIRFTADKLEPAEGALYGDLTMKGVKKPIRLELESGGIVREPSGVEKALFSISGKIKRKDWGLNYNAALETGGVLVGEDVWIECELELIKKGTN